MTEKYQLYSRNFRNKNINKTIFKTVIILSVGFVIGLLVLYVSYRWG